MTSNSKPAAAAEKNIEKLIIARYGEIHLKGDNRGFFLKVLKKNLEDRTGLKVTVENSRVFIASSDESVIDITANTFGITSVSPAVRISGGAEEILDYLKTLHIEGSFKTDVNRADKSFPYKSPEFAAIAGGVILDANNTASVDVVNPKTVISMDIRENGTYIFDRTVKGAGGLPVGTAGRALVMLSGGIDSPVAAWLAMKRGLAVDCIHFYSPPHTNEFALDKVIRLAKKLNSKVYVVNFTEIQEAIYKHCSNEYMIIIMRRFMVRICEEFALMNKNDCIITGENLAQVASQTIGSIASNNVCARVLPILRPLVTFDKNEIIDLSKKIGTYEISIEPHLDCCTVFVPKHPSTRPNIEKVEAEEKKLDTKGLIQRAIASIMM